MTFNSALRVIEPTLMSPVISSSTFFPPSHLHRFRQTTPFRLSSLSSRFLYIFPLIVVTSVSQRQAHGDFVSPSDQPSANHRAQIPIFTMSKSQDHSSLLPSITTKPLESQRSSPKRFSAPQPLSKVHAAITNKFSQRFHKFMDLPVEIRLLIWEAALPEGRVHELHPCVKLLENGKMMFRSNHSTPPTLLSVCRESRMVTLEHYELMTYVARSALSKGVRKFYFSPERDTLFLNTLMGLYMAFMLLDVDETTCMGIMSGWQNVALDADRAHLITLLAGRQGHARQPRFREVFPDLKTLTLAVDTTKRGRTRFRTSVWPGENGTSLKPVSVPSMEMITIVEPMAQFILTDYPGVPLDCVEVAQVKRKRFIRGDMRYGLRKTCSILGIRPPACLMRL